MKSKENVKEEIQFWLSYINEWERKHTEPIPDQARLLLENAILKLESYYPNKKREKLFQSNNYTTH